jgi:anti-sigma B factor antagonist
LATVEYRDASVGTFSVGVIADGELRVLRLVGELDGAVAPELQRELEAAMKPPVGQVVVDLSDLEFIDSIGIAVVVQAMREDDGSPTLRFIPSRAAGVKRVLELTGVAERMSLTDGVL